PTSRGVKISSDNAWKLSHPAIAFLPSSSKAPTSGGGGGGHPEDGGGKTGDLVDLDALNGNNANLRILGTGNQKNRSNKNSNDCNDNDKDSHSTKTGDLIKTNLLNGNNANAQVAGTGNQSNKRGLFGAAQGKQSGSADGFGGSSLQGQSNTPVLSGSGNSLTSGGSQFGENNGQGGEVQQSLAQKLGLGKRQLFASGKQQGSADGFGGVSQQGQDNRPVVSGAGNSVPTGGSQLGENDGEGGSVSQSLAQKLGLGGFGRRQLGAFGGQGASADGYGGDSFQYQNNRPVGAENNGQEGSIEQGLKQILGRRQNQGLGQGIGQGIDQTGSANAQGGSAYIYGNQGPAAVDGTATAGSVNQGASGYQDRAQSATQGLTQQTLNRFLTRQLQDLQQGIGQGIHQNGRTDAQGGSAYLVGGNGSANVKDGTTAGTVNQNGQAQQKGQQSGTQSLNQQLENLWGRRDVQGQGQGTAQVTSQKGFADAEGGNVKIVGSGYASGPVNVDASSHASAVDQNSSSNQKSNQDASQISSKANYNAFYSRAQVQGNTQNTNVNGDASAHASSTEAPHNVDADQANSQQEAGRKRRAVPPAVYEGNQDANADSHGGASSSFETNDKVVQGNGITSNQGGAQNADGSSTGGSIKQLLQL
ncbi:hypothetical protein, partial [Sporisorium scitamineum]